MMKKFAIAILLLLPFLGFGQSEKRYRSIIVDSLKALNGGRVDVKDTLSLDSLAVYGSDLSSQYTSRSLVDSAFVGGAISGAGHDAVTLSGTPDYITLSGQDIIRGQIDLGTDITGTTTATSISDFDTEVSNNVSVTANTAKVTNATHTGDVTGATALTIANKAVEIIMLDDGTDGELITWDASGVAATVATGSAGQILTSNGAGAAPTFQAGGADGNGIYDGNGSLTGSTTVTMGANSLTFDGNQTILKALDATSGNDVLLIEDNVGTDLLLMQNNGLMGINNGTPIRQIHLVTNGGQNQGAGFRFGDASSNQFVEIGANGSTTIGTPNISSRNNVNGQGFLINSIIPVANDVEVGGISAGLMFNIDREGGGGIEKSRLVTISNGLNVRYIMATGGFKSEAHNGFYDDKNVFAGADPDHVMELWALPTNAFQTRTYDVTVTETFANSPTVELIGTYDSDPGGGVTSIDFVSDLQTIVTSAGASPQGRLAFTVEGAEAMSIDENADVTINNIIYTTQTSSTLGVGVTVIAVTSNGLTLTGDGAGNTIATITGFTDAGNLVITFTDVNVTITDDNTHASNTVDLSAAFTSADDTVLMLRFDGTSYYEISRSVN